ncbi:hypothetical protein C0584_05710 [Candidatus Parcubacteria bacterium]|nr:MAG: hypothetical protein C0584_05710 [Candidatus Parcubacteria bacterium]
MPEENLEKKILENSEKLEIDPNLENKTERSVENEPNVDRTQENKEAETSMVSEKGQDSRKPQGAHLVQSAKSVREKKIEHILEVDLADVYSKLSPRDKVLFKNKGEETAKKINDLLDSAKIKVKKILSLIKDWLSIIPGVNKFFIEQLAKSKLDEIVNLKK